MARLLVLLLTLGVCCASALAAEKPNILIIVADDLGYADIGVQGGKIVPTPNIDALAAAGVRCTSGYVSCPYCSPTRAGMLTGRYQTRFGHEFNPHPVHDPNVDKAKFGLPVDQTTLADHLRGAGYATAAMGKWHLGFMPAYYPQARGFDEFFGFLIGSHNYLLTGTRKPAAGDVPAGHDMHLLSRGREEQLVKGYTTDLFTDEAMAFMDRHAAQPWFVYLAFNAVHTPLEILEKQQQRIPASITDRERRGYLSLLLGLDDAIGRVLAHLKETGHDKDTLIFFISDNGGSVRKPYMAYNTADNAPLRGGKGQTLEGGIRVPFFVTWPGKLPAGKVIDEPVIALDILPTVLTAASTAIPSNCDGVNLLPLLAGEISAAPHAALFWRFGPQKAVRSGRWKLVDWRDFDADKSSGWQLFDLTGDVGEQHDLAASQPEVVARLSQEWEQWDAKNVAPLWRGSPLEDVSSPSRKAKQP